MKYVIIFLISFNCFGMSAKKRDKIFKAWQVEKAKIERENLDAKIDALEVKLEKADSDLLDDIDANKQELIDLKATPKPI